MSSVKIAPTPTSALRSSRRLKLINPVEIVPSTQDMDLFEQQEMANSRPQVKNKLNEWRDWLVNHVPKTIKAKAAKTFTNFKNKLMGLYKKIRWEEPETKEDDTIVDSIEQEQRGKYKSVLRDLRERPQITLLEAHPRLHRYEVTGNLNNNLSKMVFNRIKQDTEWRSRIIYSFTARIYRGNGEIVDYEKTLPGGGTFTSSTSIENSINGCEIRRLDLDDARVWSRAYLPPTHVVSTPCVYQGLVEFSRIIIRVIHSNEPLMGCGPLPEWLRSKKSIHGIDDKNDNLCVQRCLAIYFGYRDGVKRPAEDTTRRALKLAREFYDDPKLKVKDVRGTKLVDFEGIGKMFTVNIRLYEPEDQKIWKLAFGKHQFKKCLPCVDIGLYEGHCFYIKDI